jgi:phenylpropionate dioxygenase-like ring-hydroxylating dioxygenase large terminal subunit
VNKKVSRRDFARKTVGAGVAAVALGSPRAATGEAARPIGALAEGAAVARRRRAALPVPSLTYGGDPIGSVEAARDSIAMAYQRTGAQERTAPEVIRGWTVGTTIPTEYYTGEKHYLHDERFLAEHFWLMADHQSRIPKPNDYFVFAFGRGESVIILRDQAGEVKAFHNVCRHRASRMVRHDRDPAPADAAQLSVKQLGPSGSTPVFRCPYHAWTYDLAGTLISAPNGMPEDFEMSKNGLIPCHVRTSGGFIFVNLSLDAPPDFDAVIDPSRTPQNWRTVCEAYGTAQLKIAARHYYPVNANWKLVLENFHECYHCGPAHRALVTAHPFWDGTMPAEQRTRLAQQLERFVPPEARPRPGQAGMGSGGGLGGAILNVGFATGSLDGKPVAPLLPTRSAYTHRRAGASTTWALGNIQCYDDYVAVVRHTPRDVQRTDVEILWLVNADAKEGRDYKPERVKALWDITEREDRWIVENQVGYLSSAYRPGRYATTEGGPSRFIQWYMKDVVETA